jgi:DNA-binding MarR family transcriptional regulator
VLLARIEQAAGSGEAATAAELSAYLGWTKQRMSRRLQQMVAQGLVERVAAADDRRKQHVLPTAAGSRQAEEIKGLQKRLLRRVFRRAGADEVAGFQNVLLVAAQHAGRGRQAALLGRPHRPARHHRNLGRNLGRNRGWPARWAFRWEASGERGRTPPRGR